MSEVNDITAKRQPSGAHAIPDVADDAVTGADARADGSERGVFHSLVRGFAERIDRTPNDVAARLVAAVAAQPRVQRTRIQILAARLQDHRW